MVFHDLTVRRVDPLTDDSVAVTFDAADGFDFAPGQSLTLRRVIDGVEHRRSYSICAGAGQRLRIGVREIPDGLFSRWLVHDVRPGQTVQAQPPAGAMRADPSVAGHHLAIAAGSGITPILSIAASLLANPDSTVTLLFGNRTTASVMFGEDLADLKNRYGQRFQLVHVLSREPRDVELFSGRLDADRLRSICSALVPLADIDHAWLCGPQALIDNAREVLTDLGVATARIHFELFYVDEPPPPLRHLDPALEGATTELTVVLDGRSSTGAARRDTSLLDSAQRTRGDLPFACKGGVCGTCRAKVRHGSVEMVRNYALEPAEVAAGFVLTCQTYPIGERDSVDYDA